MKKFLIALVVAVLPLAAGAAGSRATLMKWMLI